jgi:hypothetical protein
MEDDSHITMDNIDNLTEDELRILERKYKEVHLPSYRLYMLLPYNIVAGGLTMYYTINFKKFSALSVTSSDSRLNYSNLKNTAYWKSSNTAPFNLLFFCQCTLLGPVRSRDFGDLLSTSKGWRKSK